MAELNFLTLDVFTTSPYEGNPLGLVLVPHALSSTLSQKQKQKIAAEFNLSETAFLHLHTEDEKTSTEWRVDIFLTTAEIPFAGHPTIGTATYVMDHLMEGKGNKATLVTKSGPILIERGSGGSVVAAIAHNVHIHSQTIADVGGSIATKGLSDVSLLAERESTSRLVSVVKGMTFLCVALDGLDDLAKAEKEGKQIEAKGLLDQEWDNSFIGKYYYVYDVPRQGGSGGAIKLRTRMIEKSLEDPATGSAACALTSYLSLTSHGGERKQKYEITQGVEMGRESHIGVEVELEEDLKSIRSVKLSGTAVRVMEGKLFV